MEEENITGRGSAALEGGGATMVNERSLLYFGVGVPGAAQNPIVTSRIKKPECPEGLGYEGGNGAHCCEMTPVIPGIRRTLKDGSCSATPSWLKSVVVRPDASQFSEPGDPSGSPFGRH